MEEKSKNIFYLDPDYENFVPRKTRLKWETISRGEPKYAGIKVCIGIHLVFFIIFLCSIVPLSGDWEFDAEGVNTTFTVIGCERLSLESSQVRVTYVYTVDGETYGSAENSDANMTCEDFSIGTLINGQYLLTRPNVSRVTQNNFYSPLTSVNWDSSVLFFNCFPLPISSVLLVRHLWLRRKYHLLRTKGVVLDGELLNFYPEQKPSKGKISITITIDYQYETPDGRLLKKRFVDTSGWRLLREMPQFLTPIKVLYVNDRTVIML